MADMIFAGIPLEGSGIRPLEADLYGAEQQGVDHENVSATGNLNIGNVIQYDEHSQRFMNGGNITTDNSRSYLPELSPDYNQLPENSRSSSFAPASEAVNGGDQGSSTGNSFFSGGSPGTNNSSTSNVSNPPTGSSGPAASPTPPLPSSSSETTNNSTGSSTGNFGGDSTDSHNVTNSYNTYNETTYNSSSYNNNEYNNTQNNYYNDSHNTTDSHNNTLIDHSHDITIGNITIGASGGNGGNGGGGDIFSVFNSRVENITSITSNVVNTTINTIGSGWGGNGGLGGDTIINNVITTEGGTVNKLITSNSGNIIVGDVNNTVNNLISGDSVISNVSNNVTHIVGGDVIAQIGNTVANLTSSITNIVNNTGGNISTITGPVFSSVMQITGGNIASGIISTVNNGGSHVLSPSIGNIFSNNTVGDINILSSGDVLSYNFNHNVIGNINAPVTALSSVTLNIVNGVLQTGGNIANNILSGNVIGSFNSLTGVIDTGHNIIVPIITNIPQTNIVVDPVLNAAASVLSGNTLNAVSEVNTILAPVTNMAASVLDGNALNLTGAIAPAIEAIIQSNPVIEPVMHPVANILEGNSLDIAGTVAPTVNTLAQTGGETVNIVVNKAGNIALNAPISVVGEITQIAANLHVTDLMQQIHVRDIVPEAGHISPDIIAQLPDFGAVGSTLSGADATLHGIAEGMLSTGSSILTPVADTVLNIPAGVEPGAHFLVDATNYALNSVAVPLVDGVSGNVSAIVLQVSDLAHSAPAEIGSIVEGASSTASNISHQQIDGAISTIGTIVNPPIDMVHSLPATIDSVIHSDLNGAIGSVGSMLNPVIDTLHSMHAVDIPLPSSQSVPFTSPITQSIIDLSHAVHDTASSIVDHGITLSALTQSAGLMTPVDAGVLFNSTASASHATSTLASHDTHSTSSLLHSTVLSGHH